MEIPLKILVHSDPEGGYRAEVPGMPGCVTEADTLDELRSNLAESLTGWLGAAQDEAIERQEGGPGEAMTLALEVIGLDRPHVPNAETAEVLRQVEAGEGLTRYESVEVLFADLDRDD
jgi:predicted RNase H-like HicB family nuclease